MTKEELEKEASEKYFNHKLSDFQGFYPCHYYKLGYVESAEPREKRIAELQAYNEKLLNSDIEKHNKIVSLEAQIEKMKCCGNCKYDVHFDKHCEGCYEMKRKFEHWELKE